eukprot:Skav222305  [mRNA]  locus=scaffold1249:3867:8406:+ [translate_table: standard]
MPAKCKGRAGVPCSFGKDSGALRVGSAYARCIWCSSERMEAACRDSKLGRHNLVKTFKQMAEGQQGRALQRIPDEFQATFKALMDRNPRCEGLPGDPCAFQEGNTGEAAYAKKGCKQCFWCSEKHLGAACRSEAGRRKLLPALRRLSIDSRRKIIEHRIAQEHRRAKRGVDVDNNTGLPPPKRTKQGQQLHQWCTSRSWKHCLGCQIMDLADLTEKSLTATDASPTVEKCSRCRATVHCHAPTPDDCPLELQGLNEESIAALSHLQVDQGPVVRARNQGGQPSGYRQHAAMTRFYWKELTAKQRIEMIEDEEQKKKAKAARKYLLRQKDCSYKQFERAQQKFLKKYPKADERQRRRRLQFIETPGLETAVWPNLFFKDSMCLTVVRKSDARRVGRQSGPTYEDFEDGDLPAEGADKDDGKRHSVKRAYAALALAARVGYGSSYEVLHFAYDLMISSTIGAKKKTSNDYSTPMRVLMKGLPFSPLYWKDVHFGLIDMVRQMGFPKIFWTISPYEWSMPYHKWILDEMQKEHRGRMDLPVAETLHMTHVLLQVVKGLLARKTGNASKDPWQQHLLRACDQDGSPHVVRVFARIEFQDGTRKAPTQDYHGSGRPHVHVLVFASTEAVRAMSLTESVSATMPSSLPAEAGMEMDEQADVMPGAVEGSQLDRGGRSGWPVQPEANHWDEAGLLQLQHTEEDKRRGLRPYFLSIMDALRCHQDFQFADDDQALALYVAKYVAKFSDSNSEEWLNDAAEGNVIAVTVLSRYKNFAPEMSLAMFGARFRQWLVTTESGGKRDFIVPVPDAEQMPKEVELWAAGRISLLDFLRKTGANGEIHAWLEKKYKQRGPDDGRSLEAFARDYVMYGEKIVAANMLSRLNDRFYGQWLMLHVPFKDPKEFYDGRVVKQKLTLVPEAHRYFAMVMRCRHQVARDMWESREKVEEELRIEAHTRSFRETLLGMLDANKALVDKYLTGQADAGIERLQRKERVDNAGAEVEDGLNLNREQRRVKAAVDAAVDRALAIQSAGEDEDVEDLMREAYEKGKIFVCTGGPGTGKTTVALASIHRALREGGKVMFVYPTNKQSSSMRCKLPREVEVNTYHAGFGLDEEPGAVAVSLSQYALIVVDEISQLQGKHFEDIRKLWDQADNVYRCKDPKFNKVLQELRTSRPKKSTLKWLREKKAWTPPGKPTVQGIRKLLKAHPNTVVLTCRKQGTFTVNQLALKALFPKHSPLVTVDADVDSNPANWQKDADGLPVLKPKEHLKPIRLPVFKGAKVCFTRNVRKDIDYVNGMDAEVVGYHPGSKAIEVVTATQHRVMVWPWSDMDLGGLTYYPLKAGYADTILKYQGSELEHVTVFLDAEGVPGAAYTALSRVSYGKDVLIGGHVKASHFQPADET